MTAWNDFDELLEGSFLINIWQTATENIQLPTWKSCLLFHQSSLKDKTKGKPHLVLLNADKILFVKPKLTADSY